MHKIEEKLKTVYDPDFPMVDIYTLWLIYKVDFSPKDKKVDILITFTSPYCPSQEMLKEMAKNAVLEVVPKAKVEFTVTFDPAWNQTMIKDEDLQRMFQ